MDLSLSVVLPVHNVEATLTHNIHELLEVLPDIASRFEILIVDDGSSDQTEEVAHELAQQFPQLHVVRHQQRQGPSAAIQTGMTHTTGDVVFVHDEETPISAKELRNLWQMRHDDQLVMARAEVPRRTLSPHLLRRLTAWGDQMRNAHESTNHGGIQMIRRDAVEHLESIGASQDLELFRAPHPSKAVSPATA